MKRTGSDGKPIEIPTGATSRQGSDGHVVAIRKGYTSREGQDGRVVAIPWAERRGKVAMVASLRSPRVIPPGREVMAVSLPFPQAARLVRGRTVVSSRFRRDAHPSRTLMAV